MSRFNLAVVTNFGEVFLSSPCTTQGMYKRLCWLIRLGHCDSFEVYICRRHFCDFLAEWEDDCFEDCYSNYPSFSVTVANGLEEMTENFQKRICGI